MARKCDLCKKGPVSGNQVSHSNMKSRTRWLPNVQSMKASVKGTTRTILVCTRCIRTGKVTRPLKRTWKPDAKAAPAKAAPTKTTAAKAATK